MKKLLGLLFCFAFLLFAGITETHASQTMQYQPGYSVNDVGKTEVFTPVAFSVLQIVPPGLEMLDCNKYMYSKNALINQYKYIPYCPIVFIGKHKTKYITQYTYKYCTGYNQPPNI